jgi:hypothetical protein
MKQAPSSIFMVNPNHFGYNDQTAETNTFQTELSEKLKSDVVARAKAEFEAFTSTIADHGIEVFIFDPPADQECPDAIFPNNWITFHEDGKVILYPMLAENRRQERNYSILDTIKGSFQIKQVIDLSSEEDQGRILEGTGSIVFDHPNKIAYANESPRTNKELFFEVCELLGYEGELFKATDIYGIDIYHTNVLMNIGSGYAVICINAIDPRDQERVRQRLQDSGLEVIEIDHTQMNNFAGNMIEVENHDGERFLIMSESAHFALNDDQKNRLSRYATFLYSNLNTIESIGGGSARCMIAGIHLPRKIIYA